MAPPPPSALDVTLHSVSDTSATISPNPVLSNGEGRAVFSLDDVLPKRQKCPPLPTSIAPFSTADMFKSADSLAKPKAKRWDHRITRESASRKPSSLKGAIRHMKPGTISLCGGLPSSDYFPFDHIDVKVPSAPFFSEAETAVNGQTLTAGKHDIREGKGVQDLSVALNYGQSMGSPALLRFVTEHTEMVHHPPYSDWDVCMTEGSTSALDMALRMLLERGQYILTEEYSFSSAVETMRPMGGKVLGVKMDAQGMLPDELDLVLSNWNETERQAPKPFVLYTVPTGQNPTSSTQPLERRKAIYAVAEKHDLFILEDEPYYFLQMDPYQTGKIHQVPSPFTPAPIPEFLANLVPSYLSFDVSGRVLRLDSFSKIIAPGARAGWLTGSTQIIERIIRHHEVSVQCPSGFTDVVLYKLLEEAWGHKGFLEWLMFIRAEYTRRRDIIVNACEKYLPREVCDWNAPMAGMFHWIKLDLTKHPRFASVSTNGVLDHEKFLEIEEAIFLSGAAAGVLLGRGSWFRADKGTDEELFFRTTFAAASAENIDEAVRRMGDAVRNEFGIALDVHTNGHANGHALKKNGSMEI